MRWDGLQYYCSLDIPAGEDAMLQVSAPAGRIYPSVEGANPSIRHELLGPHPVHGDQCLGRVQHQFETAYRKA